MRLQQYHIRASSSSLLRRAPVQKLRVGLVLAADHLAQVKHPDWNNHLFSSIYRLATGALDYDGAT
jgi:hypothetical protein